MLFVADTELAVWWDLFAYSCPVTANGRREFKAWPDGLPYLQQPAIVVWMFEVMADVWAALNK